ncbi:MAG: hypothetical protein J3K34DRAFT_414696, partial [Monoraphidium minutum]
MAGPRGACRLVRQPGGRWAASCCRGPPHAFSGLLNGRRRRQGARAARRGPDCCCTSLLSSMLVFCAAATDTAATPPPRLLQRRCATLRTALGTAARFRLRHAAIGGCWRLLGCACPSFRPSWSESSGCLLRVMLRPPWKALFSATHAGPASAPPPPCGVPFERISSVLPRHCATPLALAVCSCLPCPPPNAWEAVPARHTPTPAAHHRRTFNCAALRAPHILLGQAGVVPPLPVGPPADHRRC